MALNSGGVKHGVLTDRPGTLTPDFFLNLLDMLVIRNLAISTGMLSGLSLAV